MSEEAKLGEEEFRQFIGHIKAGAIDEVGKMLEAKKGLANRIEPQYRQPPLYFAALSNNDEVSAKLIKALLQHGAKAAFKDHIDQTVLFYIFRQGKEKCAEILLSEGSSLDEADSYGQTPIFYACGQNRLDLVRKYANKENVNHVDKLAGQTSIYYAARRGHFEMCKLLIEKGANITHLDASKKTAVEYAKRAKFGQLAEYLDKQLKKARESLKSFESGEEMRKKPSLSKLPKNTYKIVYYNEKGECCNLTEPQVLKLIEDIPKMKEYLANPDTISQEELMAASNPSWQKLALKVVASCIALKCSYYFLEPVDPVKLNVPDYLDIVTRPMDLRTVKQRLLHNYYTNALDFVSEMGLIWKNSYLYNGQSHLVSKQAKELQGAFAQLIASTGLEQWVASSPCETAAP